MHRHDRLEGVVYQKKRDPEWFWCVLSNKAKNTGGRALFQVGKKMEESCSQSFLVPLILSEPRKFLKISCLGCHSQKEENDMTQREHKGTTGSSN